MLSLSWNQSAFLPFPTKERAFVRPLTTNNTREERQTDTSPMPVCKKDRRVIRNEWQDRNCQQNSDCTVNINLPQKASVYFCIGGQRCIVSWLHNEGDWLRVFLVVSAEMAWIKRFVLFWKEDRSKSSSPAIQWESSLARTALRKSSIFFRPRYVSTKSLVERPLSKAGKVKKAPSLVWLCSFWSKRIET